MTRPIVWVSCKSFCFFRQQRHQPLVERLRGARLLKALLVDAQLLECPVPCLIFMKEQSRLKFIPTRRPATPTYG